MFMHGLYDGLFYSQAVNDLYGDEAFISYMLRFEAALANAQAKCDLIPQTSAQVIQNCCIIENIDLSTLKAEIQLSGNAAIPLVKQLTKVVKDTDAKAARYIHFGATSQDVIDTAISLQLKDALAIIKADLQLLIKQLAFIVDRYRDAVMVGRTFLQHARPTTFGLKAAGWLDGILRTALRVERAYNENLVIQLGGPTGTLSGIDQKGFDLIEEMSRTLDLIAPNIPWHTQRDRLVDTATTLGILAGNIGKIATDVSLLSQTEVAEVFEPIIEGKGGSSAMPHKSNPVLSIACIANAKRIPLLIASLMGSMVQDHERGTGGWHAEWETLTEIVKLTAGALKQGLVITNGLVVNQQKMLQNLEITKGLIYAEAISNALSSYVSRNEAHKLVEQCCLRAQHENKHLKEIVKHDSVIMNNLRADRIDELFNVVNVLGQYDDFIRKVLSQADLYLSKS